MIKDITKDILLRAGFKKVSENNFGATYEMSTITVTHYFYSKPAIRSWGCEVYYKGNFADVNIKTIEHFNKLMELMDIDFKIKGE